MVEIRAPDTCAAVRSSAQVCANEPNCHFLGVSTVVLRSGGLLAPPNAGIVIVLVKLGCIGV